MKTYVLTLDLKAGANTVRAYRRHHRAVWPEVVRSLKRAGVRAMDIYLLGHRLVMVLKAKNGFHLKRNLAAHAVSHPRVAEWETLMKGFQRRAPAAGPGEWWAVMEPVYRLGGRQAKG